MCVPCLPTLIHINPSNELRPSRANPHFNCSLHYYHHCYADLDAGEVDVPMMPTEEEIRQAQEDCARLGADEYYRDASLYDTDEAAAGAEALKGKTAG